MIKSPTIKSPTHPDALPSKGLRIDRRSFLGLAFAGSLAAIAGQWLGAIFQFIRPVKTEGFGGNVYAGRIEDFPVGSVNRIMAGRFYISHTQDGLLAIYQKCSHLGCSVPWQEGEGQFHCPCHGSLFTKTGEVTGGPAPRPLDIFPVTVKNGEVWVDTARPIERNRYDPGQATRA